jgi:6-phospho-beta-glucosidase
MKLAILGGAGARVPLVLVGLLRMRNEFRMDEVVLWDIDGERQQMISRVSAAIIERFDGSLKVRTGHSLEDTLEGADFIIASVRVGGIQSRVLDEQIALAAGVLGQETVGPGGWAMALRTIPVVLEYAQAAEKIAPKAWLLNFSNPVGIVQQALLAAGIRRTIGVCDTPREMFEATAAQLGISSQRVFFDYLGLNHLGWLRSVYVDGVDCLPQLLRSPERLSHIYHVPLFTPDYLQELGLLPTEYVYFYVNANRTVEKLKRTSKTRGQMVAEQEKELFEQIAAAGNNGSKTAAAYDNFLASRNATYFQLETGTEVGEQKLETARKELYEKSAGYERIAVDVMKAIAGNRPAVFPVDVANNGAMDDLDLHDAVEVPCVIDSNGPRPLAVGSVPARVRPLFQQVKDYERLTARAALEGSATLAITGLATNPLVPNRLVAEQLGARYLASHAPYLRYLK